MLMTLAGKNKVGFVDGSIPKPTETASNYRVWIRHNNTICSWLLNSMSKEITTSVIYSDSAAAIWKDIHTRF